MAVELDRKKFSDILEGNYPIQMRLLVYYQMLKYKSGTKVLLQSFGNLPREDQEMILNIIGKGEYGIDDKKIDNLHHATALIRLMRHD
jgi:hypothetical protein